MEAIVQRYACRAVGHIVPIRVFIDRVSGIGDDEEEIVELRRECALFHRCPRLSQCPLRGGDGLSAA